MLDWNEIVDNVEDTRKLLNLWQPPVFVYIFLNKKKYTWVQTEVPTYMYD